LRYLYESARLGTMRAASEKLEVEPSTISRQIAQLEKSLGIELIERSRRKVMLTEAGKLTVDYYRDVRTTEDTYLANLENLKSARSGEVIISMGDALITDGFQHMLDGFVGAHGNLKLSVRIGGTTEIIHSVLEDESHFGFIFHVTSEPRISIRLSVAQPLQAVVSPSHPFARRRAVGLDDLAREPLALPPESFQIRQIIHEAEKEQGVFFNCAFESNSFKLLKWFARSEHGVTILNESHAHDDLQAGKLVAVPINSSVLKNTRVSLILRTGRKLPVVVQTVLLDAEMFLKKSFQR
jgi:DNA-binding transcriptional LysR family regulator